MSMEYIFRIVVGLVHVAVQPILYVGTLACKNPEAGNSGVFTTTPLSRRIRQFIIGTLLGEDPEIYVRIPIQLFREVDGKLRPLLKEALVLVWGRYGWTFHNHKILKDYLAEAAMQNQQALSGLADYVASTKRISSKKVQELVPPDWGFFFKEEDFTPQMVGEAIVARLKEADPAMFDALLPEGLAEAPKKSTKEEGTLGQKTQRI
jgi:hypothetical protein